MSTPSRLSRYSLIVALALLAACGGSPRSGSETKTVRIILDHLRFAPDTLTVKAGTTVRFVLANPDGVEHEFILGSADVQNEHESTRPGGGHAMHDPNTVSVPAGKTVELTHTFDTAGAVLFGCHVDDHYMQGMKGTVTVT